MVQTYFATPHADMRETVPVTIANGQSLSAGIDLSGKVLVAIQMPAAWTSGNLTLQGSFDGTTFANCFDSAATEYLIDAAASEYLLLSPTVFASLRFLKIRSGTSGSPVAQGADRVLQLVVRPLA